MDIKLSTLSPTHVYHLMTQTIIPRPVAWVLTDSGDENYNLAPFSYFTPVSSNPPVVMISIGKKPSGEIKDTTRNALETGKMVIHIASSNLAPQVTKSAATLDHGESEVAASGLETVPFEGFPLPRLKDCSIAFGCRLYEVKELGNTPQSLIFAEVEQVYLAPEIINQEAERLEIDAKAVDPLARLGGGEYAVLGDVFAIARDK